MKKIYIGFVDHEPWDETASFRNCTVWPRVVRICGSPDLLSATHSMRDQSGIAAIQVRPGKILLLKSHYSTVLFYRLYHDGHVNNDTVQVLVVHAR
jgi:hypothetical protein